MIKLLNANFHELFKSRFFYITLLICGFLAAIITISMYYYPQVNLPESSGVVIDESNVLSLVPSCAVILIPFAAASSVAMLMETQYNQGTVRNKLISGHTRTEVFISSLITSCVPAVIYFAVYHIFVFGISVFAFNYDKFALKAVFVSLSVMLLMIICIGTVMSFVIGNLLRGGKMIVIILAVQYAVNMTMVLGMFKNDSKILGFISKIFPQSCLFDFSYSAVMDKPEQNIIISSVLIIILTVFGIIDFKKCDIK